MENYYVRALQWPIISWVLIDVVLLVLAIASADFLTMFSASSGPLALITFVIGLWAGSKMVELSEATNDIQKYIEAIIAGIIVGIVCATLTIVGFNTVGSLDLVDLTGIDVVVMGIFAFAFNAAGGVVGGGYSLTK